MQGKLAGVELKDVIKQHRTRLGLSHEKLAARVSELEQLRKPLAWQTVQQWENGNSIPRTRRLAYIAAALDIPLQQLLDAMPRVTLQPPMEPDAQLTAALLAAEPHRRYGEASWPFRFITAEQLMQLPAQQLDDLERVIVDHLMNPMNTQWRRIALDLAAEVDQKNREDHLTTFVRAVDLKAKALRAAQLQEAPT